MSRNSSLDAEQTESRFASSSAGCRPRPEAYIIGAQRAPKRCQREQLGRRRRCSERPGCVYRPALGPHFSSTTCSVFLSSTCLRLYPVRPRDRVLAKRAPRQRARDAAPAPERGAMDEQEGRRARKRKRNAGDDARRNRIPEVRVHVAREERERAREHAADEPVRGLRRRRVRLVRVREVVAAKSACFGLRFGLRGRERLSEDGALTRPPHT